MSVDGILNLNKPSGITSFEVVRLVRRLSDQKRVGHGGTLDPLATGVLPVFLGQATRMIEFLGEGSKTYRGEFTLGISTNTYDAEGEITDRKPVPPLTEQELDYALEPFRGSIEQAAPSFSALRLRGRRFYELERSGHTPPVRVRRVQVLRLELQAWQPPSLWVEVECSKGTYIRSLAHDLGQALGCGAHLRSLVRVQSGPFPLAGAVSLERFRQSVTSGSWQALLYPVDYILTDLNAVVLSQGSEQAFGHGQFLSLLQTAPSAQGDGLLCRAYSLDGRFLGLLQYDIAGGRFLPHKVLTSEP